MLAELVIATAEDAPALLAAQSFAGTWPTFEAKGVDQVKLASLRFILLGLPPEDDPVIQYMKSFEALADGGEDGPWIESLPDDLVQLLANVPATAIPAICVSWANTEEAKLDRWLASDVEPFFGGLSAFAARAVAEQKKLLLWVSL